MDEYFIVSHRVQWPHVLGGVVVLAVLAAALWALRAVKYYTLDFIFCLIFVWFFCLMQDGGKMLWPNVSLDDSM